MGLELFGPLLLLIVIPCCVLSNSMNIRLNSVDVVIQLTKWSQFDVSYCRSNSSSFHKHNNHKNVEGKPSLVSAPDIWGEVLLLASQLLRLYDSFIGYWGSVNQFFGERKRIFPFFKLQFYFANVGKVDSHA